MTWSSPEGSIRPPRTVDELVAVEWDPEELFRAAGERVGPERHSSDPGEQDALIEAIAEANAARDREAAAELERRIGEAYARGFEEGRDEGEAAEAARLRTAVEAVEDALDALRAGETRWRGGIEENVCALAIAVAKQVLGRELRGDQEAVVELVRRAVAEFPIDQPIRIRVSPHDLAMISGASAGEAPVSITSGRDARWLADPLVSPGGCLVEGRERIVDGRVDAALERLYRRLTYSHA
jgi:flagellar assembly protein FliH